MKETEKILKALANRRRLAIIKYLQKVGSASVGDIAEEIKLSFKATSKHLDILDKNQMSLSMIYSLTKPKSKIIEITLSIL